MLRLQMSKVYGIYFLVHFVVLRMNAEAKSYSMLLGRPWFRTAKLKEDWEKQEVIMKKVKKIVISLMVSKETLPTSIKPMMAQTINLAEDVEDDEEDLFLAADYHSGV